MLRVLTRNLLTYLLTYSFLPFPQTVCWLTERSHDRPVTSDVGRLAAGEGIGALQLQIVMLKPDYFHNRRPFVHNRFFTGNRKVTQH